MFIISSTIFSCPGDNGDGNHLTPSGDGAGPAHSNLFLYSVSDYLSLKLYWSSEYIWWNSIPWVSMFIWDQQPFFHLIRGNLLFFVIVNEEIGLKQSVFV